MWPMWADVGRTRAGMEGRGGQIWDRIFDGFYGVGFSLPKWVHIGELGHNYIGHNYRGHSYIGHNYVGFSLPRSVHIDVWAM